MSAVKNLRAMFEQKGETSPPDRGRSPGIPPTNGATCNSVIGGESPRPLSKVRTDFIAIEKDGRIGLQRGISQDSNISLSRKLSGETDLSTSAPKQENKNIFADNTAQAALMSSLPNQPIPESPRSANPESKASSSSFKSTIDAAGEASSSTLRRFKRSGLDAAAEKPAASEANATPKVVTEPANGTGSGGGSSAKGKEKANGTQDTPGPSTATTSRATPKPLSVPSASKSAGKLAKSPTVSRAPKSPAETSTPKLPAKTPERFPRQPEKTDTPKMNASTSTPRASSVKRAPPLQPSPAGSSFVKPKPKSPTRPVRLPDRLTTHTAASGSKVNPARQSLSRASGGFQTVDSLGRSPSRGSVSTVATTATKTAGAKTLKRQSSTIDRPRPSLGPPPKQSAKEYPPTKNEKQVDESFLARMTRPTQASQSRVTDKAITPPRKPSVPAAAKNPWSKTDDKAVRRIVPRAAAAAGPSRAQPASTGLVGRPSAPIKSGDPPPSGNTSPSTVVGPSAPAKEAAQSAEKVDEQGSLPPKEEPSSSNAKPSTTAQEIAPVVENIASAEEAIQVAKELEGEVELPSSTHEEEITDEENVDTLVEQTEALSLEDAPETKSLEVDGHHENDEANKNSELGGEEQDQQITEASEK
ncbi:hypothetical protein B0T14DRAFT_490820 [Immersiella caudata]|uniref:Uncharacterized protein n=1 Tax=Immersiella caudata TaxID=314043 RepID=A0AA39XFK7_9PEZI|nr:hypothetical protein B0T14DRAFT_490820 [Immersiella caudata]